MKVLRFLLVLVFVFTLFVTPAQAQAGEEYGFVPLVTQVDPAIPFRIQARRAYQRLLPELLAAQQSGAITAFTPEFSAGLLKIKFAAGARESGVGGIEALDNIQAATSLVPHKNSPDLQAAVFDPNFALELYSSCFFAYDLGDSSHLVGSLRDNAGRILDTFGGDADLDGFLPGCFDFDGPYGNVLPGYRLTFKVYDTLGVLLGTYTAVAPTITFGTFNKKTSLISGTAPKNKPYDIDWYHENLDAGGTYIDTFQTLMTSAKGKWAADFGTTKFRGGDEFFINVAVSAGFSFGHFFTLPYIYCLLGSSYCEIYGRPLTSARLNITQSGATHTFTGKFDASGQFSAILRNNKGRPIFLKPGARVSGTGVAVYPLPRLTSTPDFTNDIVNGLARANKYFGVAVKDYCQCWVGVWTQSNSAGVYSADFSSLVDLIAEDPYIIEVYYVDPATGNITDKHTPVGP